MAARRLSAPSLPLRRSPRVTYAAPRWFWVIAQVWGKDSSVETWRAFWQAVTAARKVPRPIAPAQPFPQSQVGRPQVVLRLPPILWEGPSRVDPQGVLTGDNGGVQALHAFRPVQPLSEGSGRPCRDCSGSSPNPVGATLLFGSAEHSERR